MNTFGRLSRQKAKEAKKLMTLSFSLHHPCTLASPPFSTTNFRFLNPRQNCPPPHSASLSSLRMSSTTVDGSNINSPGDVAATELDHIFKQKRTIRSKVRKSLKEMDPSQRAIEGIRKFLSSILVLHYFDYICELGFCRFGSIA